MRFVSTLFALGVSLAFIVSLAGPIAAAGQEVTPTEVAATEGPLDPSPTATEPSGTPSATPTLEYEIDVPVSFFPSETPFGQSEDSVTATATHTAAVTSGSSGDDSVTNLPTAGVTGPTQGSRGWLLAMTLLAVFGSSILVLRTRNAHRR